MIYRTIIGSHPEFSLSLYESRSALSSILASYAFTMLGFLAAVVAILLSFSQSAAFNRYRKKNYLNAFFFLYAYCILTLALTFVASLLCLSANASDIFMRTAIILATNSLIQIAFIGLAITNICKRAIDHQR
ncbi:hypothetical protein [Pseudomonas sp. B392_1p]|uniref:hypothetical protein n=1 Tax=Pseudomonas sp. B392_1p TaxID=3457507 RepID=UPI003FD1A14D